jgi:hypothetical protein
VDVAQRSVCGVNGQCPGGVCVIATAAAAAFAVAGAQLHWGTVALRRGGCPHHAYGVDCDGERGIRARDGDGHRATAGVFVKERDATCGGAGTYLPAHGRDEGGDRSGGNR